MRLNESKTDRTIRIAIGVAILASGLVMGSWWGLVGFIPLLTGTAGWCPLYGALGFSTIRNRQTKFRPGTGAL